MAKKPHKTTPDHKETGWPKGVPFIIGNEGCERFSFYGMKSILWSYMAILYCAEIVKERANDLECAAAENEALLEGMSETHVALIEGAQAEATATVHFFIAGVYALPMIGAIIADRLFGKYQTIMWLSIVYCAGHATLAIFENDLPGIYAGLALIAIGSGGIKPCVSAHVGDQFGRGNWNKITKVFQIFYFIINFGSFFSTLLIPVIKEEFGWSVAFALPGVLMAIATFVFWMGRKVFIHVQPKPGGKLGALDTASSAMLFMTVGSLFFTAAQPLWVMVAASLGCLAAGFALFAVRQNIEPDDGFLAVLFYGVKVKLRNREDPSLPQAGPYRDPEAKPPEDPEERKLFKHPFFGAVVRRFGMEAAEGPVAVLKIMSIFFLVSVFWALFDQHSSSWIQQASTMDRNVLGVELLKEQIGAANPIMVMMLIPIASFVIYPGLEKLGLKMTPLTRMTLGMFVTSIAFVAVALIQISINGGVEFVDGERVVNYKVNVAWQLIPYFIITLAEVMVSITGLEFAYTQAPRRMKSTIMGFWLLTVALGSVLTGLIAKFGDLEPVNFFWLFAGLMAAAAMLFGIGARFYKYRDYTQ